MKGFLMVLVAMMALTMTPISAQAFTFGDPDFSDWTSGVTIRSDAVLDSPWHDWGGLRITHDVANVYFLYETLHAADPLWIFYAFIDSKAGGLATYDARTVNADYLIQGTNIYTNSETWWAPTDETALSWNQSADKTLTELEIPRARIGSPSAVNITLAVNQGSGVEDWLPDDEGEVVTHSIPEPTSLLLLGSGLLGLVAFARKKK